MQPFSFSLLYPLSLRCNTRYTRGEAGQVSKVVARQAAAVGLLLHLRRAQSDTSTQTHLRTRILPFTRHRAVHKAKREKIYVHSTGAVYHSVLPSADLQCADTIAKVRRDGRKHDEGTSAWRCGRTWTGNLSTLRTTVMPHRGNPHAVVGRQKPHEYPDIISHSHADAQRYTKKINEKASADSVAEHRGKGVCGEGQEARHTAASSDSGGRLQLHVFKFLLMQLLHHLQELLIALRVLSVRVVQISRVRCLLVWPTLDE